MSERTARRFLQSVWEEQPTTGRQEVSVFLASKDWETGSWEDHRLNFVGSIEIPTVEDLYFAPNTYSGEHRRKELARPGRWLYADLDEVDPNGLPESLTPTLAWETSPSRYQALWLLKRSLKPATLASLNQRLTYFTKADKGGWSLTKVLRVPGTYNNKRDERNLVKLLWDGGPEYEPSDILHLVKDVTTPASELKDLPDLVLPKADADRLYKRHRAKLSLQTRRMLRAERPDGDRSEVLWKLERELLEAGVPANQVFVMVKASVWNKYKGQSREDRQLWTEIQRAVKSSTGSSGEGQQAKSTSKHSKEKVAKRSGKRLVGFDDFISRPIKKPMWMVEGIWSESAHGILAGEPKTYKSVISTDLAISVASGTPFLNHFPIPQTGPVFMIQKENDEAEVQDRVHRIAHSKALVGGATISRRSLSFTPNADLPIRFLNNADFDLTDDLDIAWLRRQVRKLNPVLVILDPLYLLAPGVDENSAYEMTPILEKLLRIKQRYSCGTLLIHHYKKQDAKNPTTGAARISGTGVFHRWFESALLLERPDREVPLVKMVPEHRGHKPGGAVWAEFDLGEEHDLHYSVKVSRKKDEFDPQVQEMRQLIGDIGPEGVLTIGKLASQLGMSANGVKRRLEKQGVEIGQANVNGRRQSVIRLPE